MLGGCTRERCFEIAVAELCDRVAARADEMVVMTLVADAVAARIAEVVEGFDELCLDEGVERPVDSRQADGLSAAPQAVVQLLRGQVVRLAQQLGEDTRCAAASRARPVLAAALQLYRASMKCSLAPDANENHSHAVGALACSPAAAARARTTSTCRSWPRFYPIAYAAQRVAPDAHVENLTPAGRRAARPRALGARRPARPGRRHGALLRPGVHAGARAGCRGSRRTLSTCWRAGNCVKGDPHVWLDPLRYAAIVARDRARAGRRRRRGRPRRPPRGSRRRVPRTDSTTASAARARHEPRGLRLPREAVRARADPAHRDLARGGAERQGDRGPGRRGRGEAARRRSSSRRSSRRSSPRRSRARQARARPCSTRSRD